jgi:hypothetical protein
MDATGITELANDWTALISLLIVGLTQVIKTALPKIPARVIPLASVILGIGFMMALNGFTVQDVVAGMMIGFAASGIYSASKGAISGAGGGG